MMSDVTCSRRIRKRQRAQTENVSVEEFCAHNDDGNILPSPRRNFATRRFSGAWGVVFVLMLSIQACESFACTQSPRVLSVSSKPQSTLLRVIEAEAPTTEERPVAFQPSIPEHSIVCEQDSREERKPSDDDCTGEAADQQEPSETRAENDEDSEESENEKQARLGAASRAAALLGNRKSRVKGNTTSKGTSVGARRIGAASKALGGGGTLSRLTDAVRRSAAVAKGMKKQNDDQDENNLSARLTQSAIHSAVGDLLSSGQQPNIEVLGEASAPHLDLAKIQTTPPPGTILVDCPKNCRWKPSDRVSVRVATQADDLDIANLRLSVFSNFSPNMRQSFCSRSCHVLAMRRNQGATCIVATVPRYGSILSDEKGIILGTAECSIHEFFGTRLGSRRQQNSILYITEVAVSPTARRKGIGAKLMESIEELAKIRGVETLYLHVEVTNTQALKLYEKAGFARLTNDDRMYAEFTRSLGLHDGAMKGRCHHLMYKNIQHPTWISNDMGVTQRGTLGIEVSA
ncbi:unnamed protein product [Cylindrotheca closterium]|uniref:N-acetyltransferase domain-containing protein n=1 Tax=Cylindrotheca closterium TaxID=2856 RepID=A0AAD2CCI3_9STRA|nr:unnamed protein product [Cylindrotheca closterium]